MLGDDIPACKLIKAAVNRHLADMERQSTPDFPYHFDRNAAECACLYFPTALRHSIGDYATMPFELEPWQAFGLAVLMGWKRDCDNTRRFRRCYWSTARKNGKSTFGGGLAMLLASLDINPNTGKPEAVAEVILAATKREQVEKVMFAEMLRMREQSPEIKAGSTPINKQITFNHNQGYIRCVGSDKPYSGLNPLAVFKDELHEFRDCHRKFLDTMDTGGGSRCQPLDIVTTTAGDTKSEVWLEVYRYFRDVTLGQIKDESVWMWCFELDDEDDPLDEEVWPKANPNLGVCLKLDYLRDKATGAAVDPIQLNTFTRYQGNRCVSAVESAFNMELWDKCAGELSDWNEADAIGAGIDLGGRDDLAGKGLVARFPTGDFETAADGEDHPIWRYELRAQGYITTDGDRDLSKQPWANWIRDGILIAEKYPISALKTDLIADCRRFYVNDVAYDPYNGQQFAEDIEQEGIRIASMAQTCGMFNEPISDLLQAIRDGRVTHDGNPLLRWCVSNACIIRDRQDRWMYDKRDSREKIDLIVAVTMGYRRAMVAPARAQGDLYMTG